MINDSTVIKSYDLNFMQRIRAQFAFWFFTCQKRKHQHFGVLFDVSKDDSVIFLSCFVLEARTDENLRESEGEHENLNVLNSNKENKQKNESETENGRIMKDDRNKVSVINKL